MHNTRLSGAVALAASAVAASLVVALSAGGASASSAPAPETLPVSTTTTTTAPGSATTTTTTTAPGSGSTTTTAPVTTTTVPGTTTTTSPAAALLSNAMDAFTAQRAVHWVYKFKAFGISSTEVVNDGMKDGTLAIVLKGGGATARLDIVLHGKVYFRANAFGLKTFAGFKAAPAASEAGKWIVVPRSSAYFAAFSNYLTVASAVQRLYIGGTVKSLPATTVGGEAVVPVQETTKVKSSTVVETVYVRATRTPLPVEATLDISGLSGTIVYGPWDKAPKAGVPSGAKVPFEAKWL
jgi:hypothetical protein